MNDQKLKIRIQLAQQPQSMDELYPETEKQDNDEHDKPPFDRQKVLLALLLACCTIAFFSYVMFYWDGEERPSTEIDSIFTSYENSAPAVDMPVDKPTIVETDKKTINTSLSINKILIDDSIPTENPSEVDATTALNATETTNSTEQVDESTLTPSKTLISNTLEDQPQVVRAQLTSAIDQREPVDIIDHVWLDQGATGKIFFFVQLRDLMGQRVSIHWHYQDNVVAKVPLMIGSQDWRTYASKLLNKTGLGTWQVTLHDQSGKLLSRRHFTVGDRP
jgi:hypothetical protein